MGSATSKWLDVNFLQQQIGKQTSLCDWEWRSPSTESKIRTICLYVRINMCFITIIIVLGFDKVCTLGMIHLFKCTDHCHIGHSFKIKVVPWDFCWPPLCCRHASILNYRLHCYIPSLRHAYHTTGNEPITCRDSFRHKRIKVSVKRYIYILNPCLLPVVHVPSLFSRLKFSSWPSLLVRINCLGGM